MLDVDSWLREHPRDSNPTVEICARYVTLLRHICNYRDRDGQRHDALVIVAHSQGTVITADLLRFLRVEHQATTPPDKYDPGLERLLSGELPVYLFTMGCPLRQLYGLRFPYLYQWARHDRGRRREKQRDSHGCRNPIRANWVCGPGQMRFAAAITSAGTSGATDDIPLQPRACHRPMTEGLRCETCIGAGAHTHYWDESAPRIAEMLDDIVSRA